MKSKNENLNENYKVVIYDNLYKVQKEIDIQKSDVRFIGNKKPLYIIIAVIILSVFTLSSTKNSSYNDFNKLKDEYEILSMKYNDLLDEYHNIKVEMTLNEKKHKQEIQEIEEKHKQEIQEIEEEYRFWMLVGKYSTKKNTPITKESLVELLEQCAWYPDFIYAQVVIESGMGTSSLANRANNLVGMKFPKSRATTASGKTSSGYATYKNWQLCVLDKVLWERLKHPKGKPSESEYIKLHKIYAEDAGYFSKINKERLKYPN